MGWTVCRQGHRHWGPRGAAGLLLAEHGRVLLQLRARWAHQGGTWSIPGGARERGESAVEAALREAREELGVEADTLEVRSSYVATCGGWSYETVLAVPTGPVRLADLSESDAHHWAEADAVGGLPLHPAFRTAWEAEDGQLRHFVAAS